MAYLFYVDDGLIASNCPDWIQWAVDVLLGTFKWLGLWENYVNTVGLVFKICHIFVSNSDTAYGRWMTGGGGGSRTTSDNISSACMERRTWHKGCW